MIFTYSEEYCQETSEKFRTKIEIAKELIQYAIDQGIDFGGVMFDSWYFCRELVDFIEQKGKDWVSRAKENRKMVYQGETTTLEKFAKSISAWDMKQVEAGEKKFRVLPLKASLPSLKKGTNKISILICREYDENKRLKDPVFIVTNRKDFRSERILSTYQMRWTIETYFRDAKQHLGLGDYQVRGLKGIKSHWGRGFYISCSA